MLVSVNIAGEKNMPRTLFILLTALLLLGGCYSKPVRHLAADASLIQAGRSSRQDVLRYLGEPNGHRLVSPGVEEYVYYQTQRSFLEKTPFVGSLMKPNGYEMLIITLSGDRVTKCEFRSFSKKNREWAKDFTWEKVK